MTILDRIAAVVGDEIILDSEVDRLMAVGFNPRHPGETERQHRDRVLEELITDLVRERQLRRTAGLPPDPKEVDAGSRGGGACAEERGESFDSVLRGRM